ncbi:helix-turn-helix domain-containing protein [Actinotalea sp. JY-7876]|uniref:helix-turn-helix domain-containing protein n=1 Tax=Actinotalea sp. JY-7876 TaxID=2758442 RepID=UPI0015F56F3F|nr:helix-turn-helix transcriptional regulator [Actinotalea sp. JY-7876]
MAQPSEFVTGNVRAEMARHGVTQRLIAKAIGKTQQAVSYKLSGRSALTVDELQRIAALLGVPTAALLEAPTTNDERGMSASATGPTPLGVASPVESHPTP